VDTRNVTVRLQYAKYFLRGGVAVVRLECFEISHPNFTQTYRVTPSALAGVTVTHEDATSHFYTYYPIDTKWNEQQNDLDNSIDVQLGDVGNVFPLELDAIEQADGFATKPTVKYRLYRSDDLTAPMFGPSILEAPLFAQTAEGVAFTAQAPQLSLNKTGETYNLIRFPQLRGFL
jgi:hypothetical protein